MLKRFFSPCDSNSLIHFSSPWRADLTALEQRLKDNLAVRPAASTQVAAPQLEVTTLRRVRELLQDSEQRQQRELGLRFAEMAREVEAQRLADLVKIYREALKSAEPVGDFITDFWGNNVHAFCDDDDQYAKDLAAQSMKIFFGPDKPYIQGRINAYEELLEAWGGVPDHLQADFGRWLRQSDDEHKKLAREVGVSLDSGPGAARAAFAQLDSTTLADRGVIIAGNPASCIKTCQMYEDIGVDQVMLIMQTETIPHEKVMGSIEKFGKEVIPAFKNAKKAAAATA